MLAGGLWLAVGIMLVVMAYLWVKGALRDIPAIPLVFGIVMSYVLYRFALSGIVDKNIVRIDSMPERANVFSFMPVRSYLIIIVMIIMGRVLRGSVIPKEYLAIVYLAMGLALIFSGLRYIRKTQR